MPPSPTRRMCGDSQPDRKTAQASVDSYGFKDGMILGDKIGDRNSGVLGGPLKGLNPDTISKLGWNQAQNGKQWSGPVSLPQGLFLAAASPFMVNGYAKGAAICYAPMNDATLKSLAAQLSVEIAFVSGNKVEAASEPSVKPFQITEGGAPIITSINGQDYVGAYSHLSAAGAGTGFVTFRNANDIVGPSKIFLLAFFGILALGTFLAVGLSEAFTGNLVKPLEALVQAALRLSRGEYPEPFHAERKDEIGLLQETFDKMTYSLQEHEAKLRAMIDVDPLTELVNHRRFKELLTVAMEKEERLSMVVFDLDHFSDYNRNKGFAEGDEILKACARLLNDMTPADGQVARYGGEEFAVMLPGHTLDSAAKFANGVLWSFSNLGFGLTLSAGCAERGQGTAQAGSICLAADLALAQAKQLGRNRVTDFNAIAQNGADPYELNRFLQDGTIATIQALAAAVDAKDSYTKGHSQRVAEYAADLCRHVGGSDAEVELVYRTGTLHDVGKIGVPDHVLKKAGPLTPEERAVTETHPALGEAIVRKVPQLQDTLPGVRHHHERWDGKGLPGWLSRSCNSLAGPHSGEATPTTR